MSLVSVVMLYVFGNDCDGVVYQICISMRMVLVVDLLMYLIRHFILSKRQLAVNFLLFLHMLLHFAVI